MDNLEKLALERAKNFFHSNPQIKTVKLINTETDETITCSCGKIRWKFYKKWGGTVRGKYKKIIKDNPVRYNFICACGKRLIIDEGQFKYGKVKYGCSAGQCPFGKVKMDKGCITCKYVFEK